MLQGIFVKTRELISTRPMLIAAIASIIAALFASGYLKRREAQILETVSPVPVVVAVGIFREVKCWMRLHCGEFRCPENLCSQV